MPTQPTPFLSLWIHPRRTIRNILSTNPLRMIIPLALLNGVISGISWVAFFWARFPYQEQYQHAFFVIGLILGGALFGLFNLYFGALLYQWIGSWIGGKGHFRDMKCAVGWSCYPFIVASLFAFLSYILSAHISLSFFFALLHVVTLTWAFILFLHLIGEAHQFSAWKALVTLLIAFVFLFLISLILLFLITLFYPILSAFGF